MKKILFVFLLSSFSAISQSPVFKIDSIPTEGILLDKGWKWHAGDNLDFAKPDFDDSHWESIDPTQDVMELKQFSDKYMGWFRLNFKVDSSLFGKTFALSVKQTGSSQIFINGNFENQIGEFSLPSKHSIGFDPAGTGYNFYIGNNTNQSIAIKFEKPNLFLLKHIGYQNPCLYIKVVPTSQIITNYFKTNAIGLLGQNLSFIITGFFFLIAFIHFWLYFDDKIHISNLIFGIVSILIGTCFILNIYTFYPIEIAIRNRISILLSIAQPVLNFSHFIAVYILYKSKNNRAKWLFSFVLISLILLFINYDWGWAVGTILVPLIISTQIITISWIAYKSGDKPAIAIGLGEFFWIVLSIGSGVISNLSSNSYVIFVVINVMNYVGFIFPPLAIIYYFTYKFNYNRKNLELKLTEVQQLSQEKQETLQKQNSELQAALLKGQTTERQRVALDLHDNLGSTLTSIGFSMEAIDKSKMTDTEKDIYKNLQEMVTKAYNDVRLLSHNLLPEDFEKLGFTATLESFIKKINKNSTLQFHLNIDENFGRIDSKIEFELYSICMELVNNIMKHSKATLAKIELTRFEKQIKLTVSDNGIGIFKNESDGKGMKNVQARVDAIGGVWKVKSIEGEGVVNDILVNV